MNRFVLSLVVVVFATSFGFAEEKEKKKPTAAEIAKAKADILTLEKAANIYAIKNNANYPDLLDDIKFYIDPKIKDPFTSPWGTKYQYNPKGPKNGGKGPDIWILTPDGEIIGNFPAPKKDAEKPKEK